MQFIFRRVRALVLRSLAAFTAVVLACMPWHSASADARSRLFDIREFQIAGASRLSQAEVEAVVYPFLGPGRAVDDVEQARAALEKVYSDRGYLAVNVAIPPQTVRDGVVVLRVTEGLVSRLRVRGSRWFSLSDIKDQAPSLAEGTVPNINDITHDIVALNQIPDRRVTPALRAGALPGTMDVDLNVQDSFPLHGTLEVNNRFSNNTTHTRLTGSIHYDNLWQLGHSAAFSFQIAPKRLDDAKVFSAAYTVRLPSAPWVSFILTGLSQDANVSTVGGIAVAGRGWIVGSRTLFLLPSTSQFFHTITAGIDFKRFVEETSLSEEKLSTTLLTHWPVSVQYGATWLGEASQTQLGATVTFNLRGLGATADEFDAKRYKAQASFLHFRAELSRSDKLPLGMELVAKARGQYTNDPLIPSEQLIAGGADSVRGYLEAQAAGDFGGVVSLELRGPSLSTWIDPADRVLNDWRFLVFGEGAWVRLWDPLPEQRSISRLWSVGGGTRIKLLRYVNGAVDVAVPLWSEGATSRYTVRFLFRFWVDV